MGETIRFIDVSLVVTDIVFICFLDNTFLSYLFSNKYDQDKYISISLINVNFFFILILLKIR